ncbi:MAG TPA: hypothetical protein VEB86_03965 [Chryseosolibacter sp.]|nr:hypothetical protein [Chryseosolibacter sp.]
MNRSELVQTEVVAKEASKRPMNKIAQPGHVVYIRDEFYADNNLSVLEIPRYSWKVLKVDNGIAMCEFQRRGRNSVMTLTIEIKYLKIEYF